MAISTTIQINKRTKQNLEHFKEYPRETYEDIISKLVEIIKSLEEEGELTKKAVEKIKKGRADIKAGRVFSTKELRENLGI